MYISRVRLTNVRGFCGDRSVDLDLTRPDGTYAGWTVIAGRNGSGKTTLLRAIALPTGGPFTWPGLDPEHWRSRGEGESLVYLDFAPGTSDSTAAYLRIGEPREQREWGRRADAHELRPVDVPDFCAGYGPFRRLFGGATSSQGAPGTSPAARLATLFHEDASLAEGVTWLIEQHLRALERREGAEKLKSTVLAILGDGLLPDGYAIEKVDSEGLWVRRDGHSFPLREMSDGYRTVAALVVDLVRQIEATFGELTTEARDGVTAVTAPGVVLIDEVDAHLHVSWQRRIGGWLKAHFPNVQFIVTTHSPYICQSADPGGLIRLPGPDEQVAPQVVSQDLYERIIYGSGDDAVLSELFGLETLYSEKAEALRGELVELEILVLDGEASPQQIERFHKLEEMLTSSPMARVVGRVAARAILGSALCRWSQMEPDERHALLSAVRAQPHADVCQAMLHAATSPGAAEFFSREPGLLPALRDPALRAELLS